MSAMSDYLEDAIRTLIFRTSAGMTKPTTMRVALATAATTDAQTGATLTEVANSNNYSRTGPNPLDANWSGGTSSDGQTSNVSAITFPTASGSWGTVSHVMLVDSATWGAGNSLLHGALTTSKTVGNGDVFQFNASALVVTFA